MFMRLLSGVKLSEGSLTSTHIDQKEKKNVLRLRFEPRPAKKEKAKVRLCPD
jgi:hypothetical protein